MSKTRLVVESRASPPGLLFLLFFVHEVSAAVLLPATFVGFGAERFLFAVADGLDTVAAHSSLDERVLYRVRATGTQGQVVFGRAALVAVSLDCDVNVGVLLQELCVPLQRALLVRAHIVLVVIEVNVFYVSRKEFLFRSVRSCWRRGCGVDGYASGSVLSPAGSLSDEMVGG